MCGVTRDFCMSAGKGIAPRAGTTQHEGLSVKHLQRMIEATDTEEKAETTVGHGGHDQLPTKIIPWLSQKVNSKCPIKRTESLTKAELVAHGTSPKTGGKLSLRGLSRSRSCSPTSTPSVYHLAARKGGAGGPRPPAMRESLPTETTAGAKELTQRQHHRNPGGGRNAPHKRGPQPARAPRRVERSRGTGARGEAPRGPGGPPKGGAHGAAERANQRDGRSGGGRPNREPDGTQTGPGGPASGGAARPRRSGRAAPSPGPQAARAPPRATQGSRGAVRKKRRGAAPQARQRGTSGPRSRPAHRGGCGHPRRALRRGGPRGPQTRATRGRALAAPRAPGKARPVRLSGALSARQGRQRFPPQRMCCPVRAPHRRTEGATLRAQLERFPILDTRTLFRHDESVTVKCPL